MANYSLVANTQFKARNFEDLIKPYTMYTQEYRAQEDAIADLATKADVWQGLANEQLDPVAYAQYTNYANALKDQAAVIADRGLNDSSRQAMLNLKRRYASEITPIEQAYTNRKTQADEQRKALLANPTLMLSRRADTTSLDRYMENPNLGYESYSGALLTQQAAQAAAAIAKELRNYGRGKALDNFTKTWIQEHGYSAAEVAFAINHPNDPRANKVLNSIVDNVMADSGISNWADNSTLNQAYNYTRQGLWQAVGQTQVGTYEDKGAVLAAQEAMEIRKEKRAEARANKAQREAALKERAESLKDVTPSSLYTTEEKKANDEARKYAKYFYKDKNGHWRMNYAGWKEYNKEGSYKHETSPSSLTPVPKYISDFRNFMLKLNGGKPLTWNPGKLGNLYARVNKLNDYDATRETEFIYDYKGSEAQNAAKDMINRATGNSSIDIVSYKGSKKGGYTKDRNLSKEDFMENYTVLSSKGSKYGQVFVVSDKKGNTLNIRVPEVHRAHQQSTVDYYSSAEDAYKSMLKLKPRVEAIISKMEGGVSFKNLSEEEQEALTDYYANQDTYEDMLWNGQKEQGYITRGYKTEPIKIE
jgi:hypothetical protein